MQRPWSPPTWAVFQKWWPTGKPGYWCTTTPADPSSFETRLADAVNTLVADPQRAERFGRAGRQRCIDEFSWARIAQQTLEIYRKVSA